MSRRQTEFLGHCEWAMSSLHGGEVPHSTGHEPQSEYRPRIDSMLLLSVRGGNVLSLYRATPSTPSIR